ncbi:Lipase, partial [Reticulomyxa filosa]
TYTYIYIYIYIYAYDNTVPTLVGVIIAWTLASTFSQSLYDSILDLKGVPLLPLTPNNPINTQHDPPRPFVAGDVMHIKFSPFFFFFFLFSSFLTTLREIAVLLRRHDDAFFPILHFNSRTLVGEVSRVILEDILTNEGFGRESPARRHLLDHKLWTSTNKIDDNVRNGFNYNYGHTNGNMDENDNGNDNDKNANDDANDENVNDDGNDDDDNDNDNDNNNNNNKKGHVNGTAKGTNAKGTDGNGQDKRLGKHGSTTRNNKRGKKKAAKKAHKHKKRSAVSKSKGHRQDTQHYVSEQMQHAMRQGLNRICLTSDEWMPCINLSPVQVRPLFSFDK